MHRVAEGIEDGGIIFGNRGVHFPDILLKGMVTNSAKQPSISIPMIFKRWHRWGWPHQARPAVPAIQVHFRADEIAWLHRGDFLAYFFHVAAELVSECDRRANARCRPGIPFVDVQVGSANGRGAHTHQHIVRTKEGTGTDSSCAPRAGRILRNAFIVDVGIVYRRPVSAPPNLQV